MSLTASPTVVQYGNAAVLIWASQNATACYGGQLSPYDPPWPDPSGDVEPVTGSISTGPLTATSRYTMVCSNSAGNAEASTTITVQGSAPPPPTCTPPQVLINGVCQNPPPPAFSITVASNVQTLVDSSGCPADYNGTPCTAVITVSDSLGQESADSCSMNGGPQQFASAPWRAGPYTSDGPVVLTFKCGYSNLTASASITLTVKPPYFPTPDTFNVAGSDPYTFTWDTTSVAGTGGCSVFIASASGPFTSPTALVPGGTPSGSATSGFLSPAYDPWTATLYCSGAPDPGVPSITLNP